MQSPFFGVSAHSDQSRWLIGIDMDMGIKGSNNEPQGTNKMARKERANGHCLATLTAPSRSSPHSFMPDHRDHGRGLLNQWPCSRSQGYAPRHRGVRLHGYALTVTPCEEPSARFDSAGNA